MAASDEASFEKYRFSTVHCSLMGFNGDRSTAEAVVPERRES